MSTMAYYCHSCRDTVPLRNSDLICDNCGGEFIEERPATFRRPRIRVSHLGHGHAHIPSNHAHGHGHAHMPEGHDHAHGHAHDEGGNQSIAAHLQNMLRQFVGGIGNGANENAQASGSAAANANIPGDQGPEQDGMPAGVAEILSPAGRVLFSMRQNGGFDLGNGVSVQVQFGGPGAPGGVNLGDYAFGNMDRIITDLMNRVDAEGGQRGVNDDDMKNIPMTTVTQEHVDKETQCSTCFDNFALAEPVAQLGCLHIFHRGCLEPWLRQHNTCPVCRDEVKPSEWRNDNHQAPSGMVDDAELD